MLHVRVGPTEEEFPLELLDPLPGLGTDSGLGTDVPLPPLKGRPPLGDNDLDELGCRSAINPPESPTETATATTPSKTTSVTIPRVDTPPTFVICSGTQSYKRRHNPGSCVLGLAKPALSEPLSGDVRVARPYIEPSDEFVDGLGDPFPFPHSTKQGRQELPALVAEHPRPSER